MRLYICILPDIWSLRVFRLLIGLNPPMVDDAREKLLKIHRLWLAVSAKGAFWPAMMPTTWAPFTTSLSGFWSHGCFSAIGEVSYHTYTKCEQRSVSGNMECDEVIGGLCLEFILVAYSLVCCRQRWLFMGRTYINIYT